MLYILSFFEFVPLWIFIKTMKTIKYNSRITIGSSIISFFLRNIPKFRRRVERNLNLIYPEYSKKEKRIFISKFSKQLGITFTEFLFNQEFHKLQKISLN